MGGDMGPGYGPHARGRVKELELQQERERAAVTDPEEAFEGAIESDEDLVIRRAEQRRREREAAARAAAARTDEQPDGSA